MSALISACEKGKHPERALRVFETVQQQGAVPNAITCNALISAWQTAGASLTGFRGNATAKLGA